MYQICLFYQNYAAHIEKALKIYSLIDENYQRVK